MVEIRKTNKMEKEFNLSEVGTNELSKLLAQARREAKKEKDFRLYYDWIQSAVKELNKRR